MAKLKVNEKGEYIIPLSYQSILFNIIIYLMKSGVFVRKERCISHSTHHELMANADACEEEEINNYINQFQKRQWVKHGRTMPTNWNDPFEMYD